MDSLQDGVLDRLHPMKTVLDLVELSHVVIEGLHLLDAVLVLILEKFKPSDDLGILLLEARDLVDDRPSNLLNHVADLVEVDEVS